MTLFVPPAWHGISKTVEAYRSPGNTFVLQLADREEADLRIVQAEGDFVISREPLALAVPFTSPRQATSMEEALAVIDEGDEEITVMPWSEMPREMRALRVDSLFVLDEGYPLRETWSLQVTPGFEQIAMEVLPMLQRWRA